MRLFLLLILLLVLLPTHAVFRHCLVCTVWRPLLARVVWPELVGAHPLWAGLLVHLRALHPSLQTPHCRHGCGMGTCTGPTVTDDAGETLPTHGR